MLAPQILAQYLCYVHTQYMCYFCFLNDIHLRRKDWYLWTCKSCAEVTFCQFTLPFQNKQSIHSNNPKFRLYVRMFYNKRVKWLFLCSCNHCAETLINIFLFLNYFQCVFITNVQMSLRWCWKLGRYVTLLVSHKVYRLLSQDAWWLFMYGTFCFSLCLKD